MESAFVAKKRTWRRWSQAVSTMKKYGEYLGGMLADELAPVGLAAARSGWDALAAQDSAHLQALAHAYGVKSR